MHQNKDYKILLDKLISGTITDKERWTLERASLDDPFLADAIEGIYDNDVGINTNITLGQSPKTRTLSWYKPLLVAASLIFLLGFSYLIIQNLDSDTSDVMARAEKSESIPGGTLTGNDPSDVSYSNIEEEAVETVSDKKLNSSSKTPNRESKTSLNRKAKKKEQIVTSQDPQINSNRKAPSTAVESDNSLLEDEDDILENAVVLNGETSKTKMVIDDIPKLKPQLVKGHVYDQGGFPISRAVVSTESSTDTAVTNDEGYFAMTVSDMDQQINVQSSGFSPQSTAVKPELSFNLRKAQSTLGQEPMLLVETMDANELKREYSRLLDEQLREPFSICPQEQNNSKRVRMRIEISDSGQLLSLDYITELSENCQRIIEDKIIKMSLQNEFKGKESVAFYYDLRL